MPVRVCVSIAGFTRLLTFLSARSSSKFSATFIVELRKSILLAWGKIYIFPDASNLIFFPSSCTNEKHCFVFPSLHCASPELKDRGASLIKQILVWKRQLGISVLEGWKMKEKYKLDLSFCWAVALGVTVSGGPPS